MENIQQIVLTNVNLIYKKYNWSICPTPATVKVDRISVSISKGESCLMRNWRDIFIECHNPDILRQLFEDFNGGMILGEEGEEKALMIAALPDCLMDITVE